MIIYSVDIQRNNFYISLFEYYFKKRSLLLIYNK